MIAFENDDLRIHVDGNTVQVENKRSNVWGTVWVDGPSVLFTCDSPMELITVRGNAVVSCSPRDSNEN